MHDAAPFLAALWPKAVVTADRLGCGTEETGVRVVNVVDWLLGKEKLSVG